MLNLSIRPPNNWRSAAIPKKDGTLRYLLIPNDELKKVQEDILQYLYQADVKIHSAVCGFMPGKGVLDGVLKHKKDAAVIITMDLHDFFPSFPYSKVEDALRDACIPPTIRAYIQKYATFHAADRDILPQGAPTSPYLTNIGMFGVDAMLFKLGSRVGYTYSRYADDMAFSLDNKNNVPVVLRVVRQILENNGFCLSDKKTRVIPITSRKARRITGVTIRKDGMGYNAPIGYRKKVRAMLHNLYKQLKAGKEVSELIPAYRQMLGSAQYCDFLRSASEDMYNSADPKLKKDEFIYVKEVFDAYRH